MNAPLLMTPGTASTFLTVLGTLPFALGALVSTALGAAFDGSARPLALAIALAGAGAFAAERLLFDPAARASKVTPHG